MDNLPLDNEAEDFIKNRLAKNNIKYAKPNFDRSGLDILAIEYADENHLRQVTIQSKGRNLTHSPSNVKILTNYIKENFVCFLYIKIDNNQEDYLYCFFEEDFKEWKVNESEHILYIPKGFVDMPLFQKAKFNEEKINKVKILLSNATLREPELSFPTAFTPIETAIMLWKLTGEVPDYKITNWFFNNIDFNSTLISHDVFLLYLAILHGDEIENSVDFMFFPLSHCTNFDKPIYDNLIVINSESSAPPPGPWFIAYNKATCRSLKIDIYGQVQKALYCKFGDNEEFIETLLTENGEYLIYHELIK